MNRAGSTRLDDDIPLDAEAGTDVGSVDAGLSDRLIGWILTVGGLLGALAAFVRTVEKIALLKDPAYVPSCSINPILSCGSIMTTAQAEVFGFANPLIGLAAFPVVAATGAAVLARARLPRWWWLTLQAGTVFGVGFVHWLFLQSLYRIGALCPYCMIVWVVAIRLPSRRDRDNDDSNLDYAGGRRSTAAASGVGWGGQVGDPVRHRAQVAREQRGHVGQARVRHAAGEPGVAVVEPDHPVAAAGEQRAELLRPGDEPLAERRDQQQRRVAGVARISYSRSMPFARTVAVHCSPVRARRWSPSC